MRDVIGKVRNLLFRDLAHYISHGTVIAMPGVVLVFAKRLVEIILALVGEARHVFFAGKIGVVAGVAAVLLRQRLSLLHARGIGGFRRWLRLRQLGDEVGKFLKIIVGERFHHLVHRIEGAQLFA